MTFIHTDEIVIRWRSDRALAASVRDSNGVHDVVFTADGWSCSCGEDYGCAHVLAVKGVALVAS